LLPDLEDAHLPRELLDQLLRLAQRIDVEREDQPVADALGAGGGQTRARRSPRPRPSSRPRGPTVTRTGSPIRSASLNFTPGRSSRSSSSASTPAPPRAPAPRPHVSPRRAAA